MLCKTALEKYKMEITSCAILENIKTLIRDWSVKEHDQQTINIVHIVYLDPVYLIKSIVKSSVYQQHFHFLTTVLSL